MSKQSINKILLTLILTTVTSMKKETQEEFFNEKAQIVFAENCYIKTICGNIEFYLKNITNNKIITNDTKLRVNLDYIKENLKIVCNAIVNMEQINENMQNTYNEDILVRLQALQKEFKKYDKYNIEIISSKDHELINKNHNKIDNLKKIEEVIVNTSDMLGVQ
jgi:hypothetical protein